MRTGIIYKITNLVNSKIYIGQTINSIQHRFNQHINSAMHQKGSPYLGKAIRKYGADNFTIECIEEGIPHNLLNDKEIYWIEYYHANDSNFGYNLTRGGNLSCISIPVEDELIINQLWDSGKTIGDIKEKTGHSTNTINRVLKNNTSYSISESKKRGSIKATPVCQYDLQGNFIAQYSTLFDAANAINGSYQSIGQACINKNLAYGYQWTYADDDSPGKYNLDGKKHIQKPILQIDLDGETVYQRFENASDAARYCGKKDCGSILDCCKGKRKSAYGFKWRFCDIDYYVDKKDDIPDMKLLKQKRKVICVNNGKIFNTLKEAQEYAGLASSGYIIESCKHNKATQKFDKYAGKDPITKKRLTWMYYEDYTLLDPNQISVVIKK